MLAFACVAVCCSVLQCVAVCCSVFIMFVYAHRICTHDLRVNAYLYITVPLVSCARARLCCSVLQCVAVCCSVLQCVHHVRICTSKMHTSYTCKCLSMYIYMQIYTPQRTNEALTLQTHAFTLVCRHICKRHVRKYVYVCAYLLTYTIHTTTHE